MSNDDKSVSDEVSDFHNKVKNITTAQFSAYLKHVGANHNCLSCGKAELIAVQDWHWDKMCIRDRIYLFQVNFIFLT